MTSLDCCNGLYCYVGAGQLTGVCGSPPPPPPPPPVCATSGQGCGTQGDCCSPYSCYAPGGSGSLCGPTDVGCTCYYVIP
jgi:hypothetical protein